MKKSSQVHRQSVCSEQKTDSELTTRATTPAALLAAVLHPYLQPVEIEGAREREREKQGGEGWMCRHTSMLHLRVLPAQETKS